MADNRIVSFARDAVVATLVVVGLYGLAFVEFQPVQIPGYLLIVGFVPFEGFVESVGVGYNVAFYGYLLGVGLVGASLAHGLRTMTRETVPGWRLGVAGALVVIGILSLLFAVAISFQISYYTPVFITGATGLILLALAGWLAGLFGREDAVVPN